MYTHAHIQIYGITGIVDIAGFSSAETEHMGIVFHQVLCFELSPMPTPYPEKIAGWGGHLWGILTRMGRGGLGNGACVSICLCVHIYSVGMEEERVFVLQNVFKKEA